MFSNIPDISFVLTCFLTLKKKKKRPALQTAPRSVRTELATVDVNASLLWLAPKRQAAFKLCSKFDRGRCFATAACTKKKLREYLYFIAY